MSLRDLLKVNDKPNYKFAFSGVVILLITSITSLLLAPLLLPDSYSWISHTTSESAAQGVNGAWLARLGFIAYGFAIMWLSFSLRGSWGKGAVIFHTGFGALMVSTAAFSSRPWIEGAAFDQIEDFLHSFTSTAIGFAFSFGVLVLFFQRGKNAYLDKSIDCLAISAATLLSIGIQNWPDAAGFLQRTMFFVAYIWYGREAFRVLTLLKHRK